MKKLLTTFVVGKQTNANTIVTSISLVGVAINTYHEFKLLDLYPDRTLVNVGVYMCACLIFLIYMFREPMNRPIFVFL